LVVVAVVAQPTVLIEKEASEVEATVRIHLLLLENQTQAGAEVLQAKTAEAESSF
jgi:hypothetical protein